MNNSKLLSAAEELVKFMDKEDVEGAFKEAEYFNKERPYLIFETLINILKKAIKETKNNQEAGRL